MVKIYYVWGKRRRRGYLSFHSWGEKLSRKGQCILAPLPWHFIFIKYFALPFQLFFSFAYQFVVKGTGRESSSAVDAMAVIVGSNVIFDRSYGGRSPPLFPIDLIAMAASRPMTSFKDKLPDTNRSGIFCNAFFCAGYLQHSFKTRSYNACGIISS